MTPPPTSLPVQHVIAAIKAFVTKACASKTADKAKRVARVEAAVEEREADKADVRAAQATPVKKGRKAAA